MSGNGDLRASFIACEEVSPLCPVEATVLGYTPNLGANVFFAVAFGIAVFATIGIGVWKKTWTFTAAVALGAGLETMGLFPSRPSFREHLLMDNPVAFLRGLHNPRRLGKSSVELTQTKKTQATPVELR